MSRRYFEFSEGTSNKFWAIELAGASHTVQFGKIGTDGQTQTKDFASEAEAQKSYDKLVTEKTKKGYVESGDAAAPAAASPPKAKTKPVASKKAADKNGDDVPAAMSEATPAAKAPKPVQANAPRRIDLAPADWHYAGWRKLTPLPKPPGATPFDLEKALQQFAKVSCNAYGWDWRWEFVTQTTPTPAEAHFWFAAMTSCSSKEIEKAKDKQSHKFDHAGFKKRVAAGLAKDKYDGKLSVDDALAAITGCGHMTPVAVVWPLFHLFPLKKLLEVLTHTYKFPSGGGGWDSKTVLHDVWNSFSHGFRRHVNPYLTSEEKETLRSGLRPMLKGLKPQMDHWPVSVHLAASLGMGAELLPFVQALADDTYQEVGHRRQRYDVGDRVQYVVLGLGDAREVEAHMRRLKLDLNEPDYLRGWLAHTEYGALDLVRDAVLNAAGGYHFGKSITAKERAEEYLQILALVKAPEAAPFMLDLKLNSKAPSVARQWLEEEASHAISGLAPLAATRGKLGDAVLDYFRDAKKKGLSGIIQATLKSAPADAAERIRKEVLEHTEKEYAPLDGKSTPKSLATALAARGKPVKLPPWANPAELPPLLVGEQRLADEQVTAVLMALARSKFEAVDPLVAAIREHGAPAALDAFAWKLFQIWLAESAPSKEKWAMGAVGLLGGDASVLNITPLIRNWPGESQHQRATYGLECLRAVGTDTALMALNGIAQKLKFKGLKQAAAKAMEDIATSKGLTRSQLEDRIVPDCDLDERGARTFDFGPRQFRFVLGPEMKPMLKDSDGKVKPDLPKPGAKDDAKLAGEAVDAWKLMKKQIKEVATIQAQRLEQAMVTGRRWPVTDFETLLVKHPLMTNLVRLVVWGGYDSKGKLTTTFRVTEDQTCADQKDKPLALKGLAEVGIVHPLHLSDEQKSAWGEVFSDYEIVPPFAQLGRPIFRLEKGEQSEKKLLRFKGIKMAAPTMVFGLEKLGWTRGLGMDAGCFDEHSKQFPACEVTAVARYDGTVGMGYIDPNETLSFTECYFVPGLRGPGGYGEDKNLLKLSAVDAVAVSEVLTDLTALAAKGK